METLHYVAAIDLGSAHIAGVVGRKNNDGTVTVLATDAEPAAGCIRRGHVFNVDDTARKINRLVLKLRNKLADKLPELRIEQVYVGVGGQSLRSMEHAEVRILRADEVVSNDDIQALNNQCRAYQPDPDMLDVIAISPPAFYVDGTQVGNPLGIPCKRIEARYRLIVGRRAIRKLVQNTIERTNVRLAGLIVSPFALADAMLTTEEKELGCALINFGAGVTALVVYNRGTLVHLSVIPMGGDLITKDLTTLHLLETEAERVKITYGSATLNREKEPAITVSGSEGKGVREVDPNELNVVIEARVREIVENVYASMEATGELSLLGAGIVLAGGAAELKNLQEVVRNKFTQEVRYSIISKRKLDRDDDDVAGNPVYMTAVGLLTHATANCISFNQTAGQHTIQQPTHFTPIPHSTPPVTSAPQATQHGPTPVIHLGVSPTVQVEPTVNERHAVPDAAQAFEHAVQTGNIGTAGTYTNVTPTITGTTEAAGVYAPGSYVRAGEGGSVTQDAHVTGAVDDTGVGQGQPPVAPPYGETIAQAPVSPDQYDTPAVSTQPLVPISEDDNAEKNKHDKEPEKKKKKSFLEKLSQLPLFAEE